ncbi:hypothetical protein [Salinithrix halophila]|uniref:Uncharacterized protein n=1 Tax=Salinithrix halophila TaxID=1485204 RepID=A0ABV8J9J7_9BACL
MLNCPLCGKEVPEPDMHESGRYSRSACWDCSISMRVTNDGIHTQQQSDYAKKEIEWLNEMSAEDFADLKMGLIYGYFKGREKVGFTDEDFERYLKLRTMGDKYHDSFYLKLKEKEQEAREAGLID